MAIFNESYIAEFFGFGKKRKIQNLKSMVSLPKKKFLNVSLS